MQSAELAYSAINALILPPWLLLIFAPKWSWTRRIVHSALYPLVLALIYVGFIAWAIATTTLPDGAGFTTLDGLMKLFASPVGVLAGWTHYLVFDLFVGAWIGRDSLRRRASHMSTAVSQIVTLFAGPLGLAIWLLVRPSGIDRHSLSEDAPA